jgi:hypothetical protein
MREEGSGVGLSRRLEPARGAALATSTAAASEAAPAQEQSLQAAVGAAPSMAERMPGAQNADDNPNLANADAGPIRRPIVAMLRPRGGSTRPGSQARLTWRRHAD